MRNEIGNGSWDSGVMIDAMIVREDDNDERYH